MLAPAAGLGRMLSSGDDGSLNWMVFWFCPRLGTSGAAIAVDMALLDEQDADGGWRSSSRVAHPGFQIPNAKRVIGFIREAAAPRMGAAQNGFRTRRSHSFE